MKLLTRKYNINAQLEHVHYCFSDIDYIYNKITTINDVRNIRVIKNNNELEFVGETTLFKLTDIETIPLKQLKVKVIPTSNKLKRLGTATIICDFSSNNETTQVETNFISNMSPNIFWRIFIKAIVFILFLQSRTIEKQYINEIEKIA